MSLQGAGWVATRVSMRVHSSMRPRPGREEPHERRRTESRDGLYHHRMSPDRRRRPPLETELLLARHRRQRAVRRRRARTAIVATVAALLLLGAGAVVGGGAAVFAYGSSCDLSSLRGARIGQNSFVYAADGTLLGVIPAERNRQPVTAGDMSIWVRKATIAVEDRRFFEHGGVDLEGIARAAVADVRAGAIVEGGSTITQQLVRDLYISQERTIQRKLKEACLAAKLDGAWGKQRILTTYLNRVYYGNQAYGIEAASRTYFSKHASELTLSESAFLAGLTQAPSSYDPMVAPAPRGCAAERGARGDARHARDLTAALSAGRSRPTSACDPAASSTRRSASRTSSGTCATS